MTVAITEARDYRLYLTKEMEKQYPKADKEKAEGLIELMMSSFMDGIAFSQLNLKVEVDA